MDAVTQKAKNPEKKKEIRGSMTRIEQQIREEKVRRKRQEAEAERKVGPELDLR